ncbi:Glycosyl phosphatidyl inositol anchor synthesis, partial [Linderina macrospora]
MDVKQADIAPLMSTLIGLNFPLNSVGTLPVDYLDTSNEFRARAALANSLQILEQYRVKHDQKQQTEMHFTPYAPMHEANNTPEQALARINRFIDMRRYEDAMAECDLLSNRCLEGLRYFQRYDWLLLRSIVAMGYLGWIVFSLLFIFKSYVLPRPTNIPQDSSVYRSNNAWLIGVLGLCVFLLFSVVFYRQNSPAMYYAYVAFPTYFWTETAMQVPLVEEVVMSYLQIGKRWRPIAFTLAYVLILEALVYAYFDRRVYSVAFGLLATILPLAVSAKFRRQHAKLLGAWVAFCLLTSVFTLLPVERNDHLGLVFAGGILITISGVVAWFYSDSFVLPPEGAARGRARDSIAFDKTMILFETLLVGLATFLGPITSIETEKRKYLPRTHQIACWAILITATGIPLLQGTRLNLGVRDQHFVHRLVTIYLSFATPFV